MTGLTVTVWYPSGRAEVPAAATPVAGLVVSRDRETSTWAVTHARSGAAILKLATLEAAQYAAVRLGPLADWELPGGVLRDLPGLRDRVVAVARELRCWELTLATGRPLTDAELDAAETS